MANILITGGSGLVGQRLTRALIRSGHVVRWLSRSAASDGLVHAYRWDVHRGTMDPEALDNVDAIVHLAGAGIAEKRWSESRVGALIESRAESARLLLRTCQRLGRAPRSFISAAGIGYYGAVSRNRAFAEDDGPGTDTIARISTEWERAVDEWSSLCRVVKLRAPIVLAREGGALPKLAGTVRWGIGAPLGSGRQCMPWVHIDDLCAAYQHALGDDRMRGAYNVAAATTNNRDFTHTLARVLNRPVILPSVPAWLLRAVLGERAALLLEGSPVDDSRLRSLGFTYRFEKLDAALQDLEGS